MCEEEGEAVMEGGRRFNDKGRGEGGTLEREREGDVCSAIS